VTGIYEFCISSGTGIGTGIGIGIGIGTDRRWVPSTSSIMTSLSLV
jgi:hypothetical protein